MQIVTHFKGELLWLLIEPPLLHDEAHELQGEPKRLEGDPPISMSVSSGLLSGSRAS